MKRPGFTNQPRALHFTGTPVKFIVWEEVNNRMAHMVRCVKYGREMEGLEEPPFDSELGQKIYNNVSKQAWAEWGEHQKMLMNEYRLQPWKKEAQDFLVQQLQSYFFGEGSTLPKEYVPPAH